MSSVAGFPNNRIGSREFQSAVEIPLTKGKVALVDAEDFARFGHLKWTCGSFGSRTQYAYRNVWGEDGKCRTTLLHRAILGAQKGQTVDHINRNTFDCRKANLRFVTPQQNACNRVLPPSKHGFRGVAANGPGFRGHVVLNRRSHYTRTFPCPILAAAARDVLAQRLHGEYAVLNFQFVPLEAQ